MRQEVKRTLRLYVFPSIHLHVRLQYLYVNGLILADPLPCRTYLSQERRVRLCDYIMCFDISTAAGMRIRVRVERLRATITVDRCFDDEVGGRSAGRVRGQRADRRIDQGTRHRTWRDGASES
jgi:hypothetical protein